MIIFYIAATILCTLFLVSRRGKSTNGWQIAWLVVCALGGAVASSMNSSEWNYTKTTQWMIRGPITTGPGEHLFTYFLAQVMLLLIVSYLLGRILNSIVRSIIARGQRSPLPNGEKRKTSLPFKPVCYCCNERKSFWSDYPSKICGQRICFDCLKALNFDSLGSELKSAAFEGLPPFNTADDVINECKKRLGTDSFSERLQTVLDEKGPAPKPPRTALHVLQIIGSVYCLVAAVGLVIGSAIAAGRSGMAEIPAGRVALIIGLTVLLLILGILGIRGFSKWRKERAAARQAENSRNG